MTERIVEDEDRKAIPPRTRRTEKPLRESFDALSGKRRNPRGEKSHGRRIASRRIIAHRERCGLELAQGVERRQLRNGQRAGNRDGILLGYRKPTESCGYRRVIEHENGRPGAGEHLERRRGPIRPNAAVRLQRPLPAQSSETLPVAVRVHTRREGDECPAGPRRQDEIARDEGGGAGSEAASSARLQVCRGRISPTV